ncbi:MAG TPA: PH domain-containing protein, partial [Candidatus Dormibacteraeota bacterium]|nr:PH domain-containing protein [Candidatus Dormibacteraeota bacterium]
MRTRLRPDEELVAVVRRHWLVLGGPLAWTLVLLGCLIGALLIRRPWVAPVAGVALALCVAWAAWRWLDWRCDLWAVTTQRVIDESGVLSVRMIDSPLDRIENVTCLQSLWGRVLGYGTLNVQTAAEAGSTTIEKVTRPIELKEMILAQQESGRYRVMARQVAPL